MIKKYTTVVTTEWELRGDVTPEMINERIKAALNIIMMTNGEVNYAFTGSDYLLETSTVEVQGIDPKLKNETWGALYIQAQGMDSNSLCEHYADAEVERFSEKEMVELIEKGRES